MNLLQYVVDTLCAGRALPAKYKDHSLTGNWENHRECHITPDWLLIYKSVIDSMQFAEWINLYHLYLCHSEIPEIRAG